MTPSQAVEAAALGVSVALNIVWAGYFLRRWLERRQMRARWLAKSSEAYTIIPLQSRCTCCPEHGPQSSQDRSIAGNGPDTEHTDAP